MRHSILENIGRLGLLFMAGSALFISLLDFFGLLDNLAWLSSRIPTITLLFVAAAVLYWLQEQEREHLYWLREQKSEHEKMEQLLQLLSSNFGAQAWRTTEQAMTYLAQRFGEAERSVYQAAMAPSLYPEKKYQEYDRALTRMLEKNTVKYNHVVLLDETRWKRVRTFLHLPDVDNYFVYYYDLPTSIVPNLSFAVIDKQEVVMRYPYGPADSEKWVSIKHVQTVDLFVGYFESLRQKGKPLIKGDQPALDYLDEQYGR